MEPKCDLSDKTVPTTDFGNFAFDLLFLGPPILFAVLAVLHYTGLFYKTI
jgi:hypothetical protein